MGVNKGFPNIDTNKGATPSVTEYKTEKHYHFKDLTVKADNPSKFFAGIDHLIISEG